MNTGRRRISRTIFAVVGGARGRALALAAALTLAFAGLTQILHELEHGRFAIEKVQVGDPTEHQCEICASFAALGHGVSSQAFAFISPSRPAAPAAAAPARRIEAVGVAQRNRGPPHISCSA